MMKTHLVLFFLNALFLNSAIGQSLLEKKSVKPIICYQSGRNDPDYILPPEQFRKWNKNRSARFKTANIEVEYINFPSDDMAKAAFQFAVDIWETQITSPVTIRVKAQWGALESGVLGQANWGTAFANFEGAQNVNTFYPVALAEKISGKDLNPTTDPDIVATFNSSANWYYGTDGAAPAGTMDLVTIVLHEIAHGLGFTDTYNVQSSTGSVGFESAGTNIPFVYDLFVENNSAQKLFTQFLSPSSTLKNQLTSNNLYFNSPLLSSVGPKARLYAPTTFNDGSSISHLDEGTYTTQGDPNKLMTPQIAFAEVIHDPGPLLLNILKEIGWTSTKIIHTPLKDTEQKDGAPYVIKAIVVSDNGYNTNQVTLNYTTDNVTFMQATMTPTGVANEYVASLPGRTSDGTYGYYISVVDALDRTFTNPGKIQAQSKPAEQGLVVFQIGPDTKAPEIVHTPVYYLKETETSATFDAQVTDNIGVQSVKMEYSVNSGQTQTLAMDIVPGEASKYTAQFIVPATLAVGDKIQYRIIATDLSSNVNTARLPSTGSYTVLVTGILPTRDFYVNDFNQLQSDDFFGNGFHIVKSENLITGAINSDHPYQNGSGPNYESNYVFQLQIPIKINPDNPYLRFDEIVLVEPGENGSVFGSTSFYDYVIVEGSKDSGVTWKPLLDGYDCRANSEWSTWYGRSLSNDNSESIGKPSLYKERLINMVERGSFAASDEILIRFRLFADQAAYGWGWAIDNLSIQGPVTGLEHQTDQTINLYPNPAGRNITIEFNLIPQSPIHLEVLNAQGQKIADCETDQPTRELDIRQFSPGIYFLKTSMNGTQLIQKFIKSKD